MSEERKVTRVLVMLEYGPDDPNNGEVFDLTALVGEIHGQRKNHGTEISLEVKCNSTYRTEEPTKTMVSWKSYTPEFMPLRSGHLVDVINATLPDDERVTRLKEASKRLQTRAAKLMCEAADAKLEQAASLRHLHAVARVTQSPLALVADDAV